MHTKEPTQLWIDTVQEFDDPIPQPKSEHPMLVTANREEPRRALTLRRRPVS